MIQNKTKCSYAHITCDVNIQAIRQNLCICENEIHIVFIIIHSNMQSRHRSHYVRYLFKMVLWYMMLSPVIRDVMRSVRWAGPRFRVFMCPLRGCYIRCNHVGHMSLCIDYAPLRPGPWITEKFPYQTVSQSEAMLEISCKLILILPETFFSNPCPRCYTLFHNWMVLRMMSDASKKLRLHLWKMEHVILPLI